VLATELQTIQLKSNEKMVVVKLTAPAPDWEERVVGLLSHKGQPWINWLRLVLNEELPGLKVHFYLGLLGEELVGNIMTTEAVSPQVGIVGHVFTVPAHRRKGICTALMDTLTEDFIDRGGQAMTLGTGYDSAAFHIYASFGFESVAQTGRMIWEAQPGFLKDYFAAGPTTVRDIGWSDWALLDLLYTVKDGDFMRSVRFAQYRPASYEGLFPQLHDLLDQPSAQSKVLEKEDGEVVGHATLLPDPRWQNSVLLLDLFVHPNFYEGAGELLAALPFPADAKIQAFAEATSEAKIALLKGRGLQEEAILLRQLTVDGEPVDVVVLAKVP